LIWKHIQSERIKDYKYLLSELIDLGYTINSITIDGKRGLYKAFEDYPVQMCHFHQKRIIQRYITKHPKLQASKDLQKILQRTNLPYLFAYKNHKYLDIHNTTNSLDGGVFSPMKMLIKIHRGLTKSLKLKMVDDYLVRNKKINNSDPDIYY